MERGDITFYLSTAAGALAFGYTLWKLTVGAPLNRLREQMVTKLHLEMKFSELREFLRKEFVTKEEFNELKGRKAAARGRRDE